MLGDAASANWPFAPAQLALIYTSNSPGSDANATGCALDDSAKANELELQGAELNDPQALFLLIGTEIQDGKNIGDGPWLPKLQALASRGIADAQDDLNVVLKMASSGPQP